MTAQTDPRITEILNLAAETGMPLALRPETIVALEDYGYMADPFTGALWHDPDQPVRFFMPQATHGHAAVS
jgi:hypothetical protein